MEFHRWIETQETSEGLSAPTFHTDEVTTINLTYLVNYLLDKKYLEYVLLGNIQSDYLKGRLGSCAGQTTISLFCSFCKLKKN